MLSLAQGDLAGARRVLEAVPSTVEPTALVAHLATYFDLVWVLDEGQRALLLRLTPSAFDGDRALWALCLFQADALEGDAPALRATRRRRVWLSRNSSARRRRTHSAGSSSGCHWRISDRRRRRCRKASGAWPSRPSPKDALEDPYLEHLLVRIYILTGDHEKALDQLEPLLKVPYHLSPGWLRIDPNFEPLRGHPRFQKLVAGG